MRSDFLRKWWISDHIVGECKQRIYTMLQKIYLFDVWHLGPINYKPYAWDIVFTAEKYIDEHGIQYVVEMS